MKKIEIKHFKVSKKNFDPNKIHYRYIRDQHGQVIETIGAYRILDDRYIVRKTKCNRSIDDPCRHCGRLHILLNIQETYEKLQKGLPVPVTHVLTEYRKELLIEKMVFKGRKIEGASSNVSNLRIHGLITKKQDQDIMEMVLVNLGYKPKKGAKQMACKPDDKKGTKKPAPKKGK